MSWADIFSEYSDGIVITVSKFTPDPKRVTGLQVEYTYRFEARKKDEKGVYYSPNIPVIDPKVVPLFESLFLKAAEAIQADQGKDKADEEHRRVKLLAAKPGANLVKDKHAPRSTGKTAKKKARLAAKTMSGRANT